MAARLRFTGEVDSGGGEAVTAHLSKGLSTLTNPLILKLGKRDDLSAEEKQVLENAIGSIRDIAADEDLVREGDSPAESTLLLVGFTARYKILKNGGRQITAINVPGDFVDLQCFLIKPLDHGIVALSPCRVAAVPHRNLREITDHHPHLTRMLWLDTLLDAAIHRTWLVALGGSAALSSMAHLFCELFKRLEAVGLTEGLSYRLVLTQAELADVLGLSHVHVNRTIQELRSRGLVSLRRGILEIIDWDQLVAVAGFDATYLNLEAVPR